VLAHDKSETNERIRFREVAKLMETELYLVICVKHIALIENGVSNAHSMRLVHM
jgi:hypothetical protein